MRRTWTLTAALALLLAACAADEGETPMTTPTQPAETQPAETEPAETEPANGATGSRIPTPGEDPGEALTLDDIMNEPELYTEGEIGAISAQIATEIGSADAYILEAGDEVVLMVPPEDTDVEVAEGDTIVLVNAEFDEFNPAQVGEIPGVVDEAAIVDEFQGEYYIVAESLQAFDE